MLGAEAGQSGETKPSIRELVWSNVVVQTLLAVMGGFMADYGVFGTWVMNAIATYWVVALLMLIFRRSRLTKLDYFYLRFGFMIFLGIYLSFGATIHEWVHQLR